MQRCGHGVNSPEQKDHAKYQTPEQEQPQKRKPIGFGVEKYETPEEIDSQLNDKNIQTATSDC